MLTTALYVPLYIQYCRDHSWQCVPVSVPVHTYIPIHNIKCSEFVQLFHLSLSFPLLWVLFLGPISCTCFLARHSQRGDGDLLKAGLQAERAVVEEQKNHLTREQASLRLAVEQMEKDILQIRGNISQLGGPEVGNH